MFGLIRRRAKAALEKQDEPNPAVALAVGLVWVFRTAAGSKMMQELETAVRKYSADPQALWKLVSEGERPESGKIDRGEVIDTTLVDPKELPPLKK
ncbi:MAG TPA: hypothetical protein VIA18_25755 [Polyangia bacterium]|jgi:hypothetical protein|nr:hypothetical protein [Polyangia bacterium]